jgi:oligopeptide transport system substrate-binding protein
MKFLISTIYIILLLLIFSSCKKSGNNQGRELSEHSGGTLRLSENNQISTIFPLSITSQVEGLITSQIHESIMRLNSKNLELTPGLAEKWDVSADGKLITFTLRKGVYFHDDECYDNSKGPELTSKDVKFTFELLATRADYNLQFATALKDRIVGVNDFYDKKTNSISGFRIIDDYTFSVELIHPSLSFLKILANPSLAIINEKAFKKYGKDLKNGLGPFKYSSSSSPEKIILVKNDNYYAVDSAGFALPYLDSVVVNILPSVEFGLQQFEQEKLDLINTIPSQKVKEVVEKNIQDFVSSPPRYILHREPEMYSQYYTFNTKRTPFDNIKLRKAINYAIDRDKLVDNVLQGQAIGSANFGITPKTFIGYNTNKISGYTLDIKKAKQLLAEAGYPGGIGLPEISILVNSGNSRNSSVAVEIQKQLKENLNLNVNFESLPNVQKYDLQMRGKSDIYRDAWVADYPSPESFLSIFLSDGVPEDINAVSFPNTSRYQNPIFDSYFKKGRDSNNRDTSYFYFMKAEQVLIDDAAIIPLWYEGSYRMLSANVKNFHLNAMRYYDLTQVYKVSDK